MSETGTDTDLQLLARYSRDHAEDAFAEIVRRHLALVYSAALRQVRSPQLAEEVAQSAFTDLARNAHRLTGGGDASSPKGGSDAPSLGSLTPWLYQVTRRTAIDVVRRETRRQLREQIATEMNSMNATTADWTHIEPLLDEAMHALDDTDRAAVLLRYFENKSLHEVGATLGTSDDAAQKRVSRAVERLREFFAQRGVTVGASGLIALVSVNAVGAAPVGLGVTISTAATLAGTTLATTTTATVNQAIAMTTLQKTILGAALAAAVATGIYEARQAAGARAEVRSLEQQQAPLTEQIAQLARERDDAKRELAVLRDDIARLNRNSSELAKLRGENVRLRDSARELTQLKAAAAAVQDPGLEGTVKMWAARATLLRQRLEEKPEQRIPELGLLTEKEWLDAVKNLEHLEADGDFRQAAANLRNRAKETFGELARKAIKKYAEANDGLVPADFAQLQPYFDKPVDDAVFQRYAFQQSGKLSELKGNAKNDAFLFAETAPAVDVDYDNFYQYRMNGTRSSGVAGMFIEQAAVQFAAVNNGLLPTDPSQLSPYLKQPVDPARIQKMMNEIPPSITTLEQLKAAGYLK